MIATIRAFNVWYGFGSKRTDVMKMAREKGLKFISPDDHEHIDEAQKLSVNDPDGVRVCFGQEPISGEILFVRGCRVDAIDMEIDHHTYVFKVD